MKGRAASSGDLRRCGVATALAVAAMGPPAAATDLPQIQARGTLRVIVAADEQPEMFNLGSGGEPGFEREMIEAFARPRKLAIEPVSVPRYADRIPALLAGKGDLIAGLIRTAERAKLIDFALETMPNRIVAVTLKPHRLLKTVDEFREEKVGVLKGTTTWLGAAVGAGVPEAKIRSYPDLDAVFAALRAGEITASVMSASDMGVAKRKHPELQPGLSLGSPGSGGWGVRKGDKALLHALAEYLDSVRKTATWSRLLVKYFGEDTLLVLGKRQ